VEYVGVNLWRRNMKHERGAVFLVVLLMILLGISFEAAVLKMKPSDPKPTPTQGDTSENLTFRDCILGSNCLRF
jgi:hypothetical protein